MLISLMIDSTWDQMIGTLNPESLYQGGKKQMEVKKRREKVGKGPMLPIG